MSKKLPATSRTRQAKTTPATWLKTAAAALDCLQTNVFIANTAFEIVYLNPRAKQTIASLAGEMQRIFGVEVDDIVGMTIHRFHRDPAHVERLRMTARANTWDQRVGSLIDAAARLHLG